MSFVAALDHLHALGQELVPAAGLSAPRRKFDLEHMRVLAHELGDPQHQFPAVLIAGTNGKGSTAATLAAILAAAGYRTGLYTSPHLARVTERIRISTGILFQEIAEDDFARLYFRVDDVAQTLVSAGRASHYHSFFESLTALAFLHFAEQKVDIAILEVGMGGRLDATNIVSPLLSVITDIALDHQDYLGNTIAAIAREKAGILRENSTLITLPQHPEANQAIGEAAIALNVRAINAADFLPGRNFPSSSGLHTAITNTDGTAALAAGRKNTPHLTHSASNVVSPMDSGAPSMAQSYPGMSVVLPENRYDLAIDGELLKVRSPLAGQHQQRNIALAIAAAAALRNQSGYNFGDSAAFRNRNSYNITNSAIEAGIANTSWPGRLEFLPPNLLLDVAHNPAGAWTLRAAIATLREVIPRTLIFSCLRDKDLAEMAQILFPLFDSSSDRPHDHIVLAPIHNPRAAALDDLLAAAHKLDVPVHAAQYPAEALALARSLTPADGLILATGSIYLVGALRELVLAQ